MAEKLGDSVWARARAGRHPVIVGLGAIPPAPSDLKGLQKGDPVGDRLPPLAACLRQNDCPPPYSYSCATAYPVALILMNGQYAIVGEIDVRSIE